VICKGLFALRADNEDLLLCACLGDTSRAADGLEDGELVIVVDVAAGGPHLTYDSELEAHQAHLYIGMAEERVDLLLEEVTYLVDGHACNRDISEQREGDVALRVDAVAHHIGGTLVGYVVHVGGDAVSEHLGECSLGGLCLDADIDDVTWLYLVVGNLHGELVWSGNLFEVTEV